MLNLGGWVKEKVRLARKHPGDAIIAIVLSIILAVSSWEAFTAILPFVLEDPAYGSVIFIALGVMSWALRRRIMFSFKFVRRYLHEARVNIMLKVSWGDPDETLEVLDPIKIKIKEHKRIPSWEQRKASACAGTGVPPATPVTHTSASKKKKNGTIRKRK
jgi:hypothetical protein